MSVRVYALTDTAPLVTAVRGIDHEPLRVVTAGAIGAVAGRVRLDRRGLGAGETRLRAYDATMRRLADGRRSLVPARFDTILRDERELQQLLRDGRKTWQSLLNRVRGRVQMTIRVLSTEKGLPGDLEAPERAPRDRDGIVSGTAYLREQAARAARARVIPGFESVREAVAPWVRGEEVEHRTATSTVYHLIPRSSADAYRRAALRAAALGGVRIVVTGPWPPYAFARC